LAALEATDDLVKVFGDARAERALADALLL
jgi:hypothetical protein